MVRVALISIADARDVRGWSGIPFYVARALDRAGVDLRLISPLDFPRRRVAYARWCAARWIGRSYRPELEPAAVRKFARDVRGGLSGQGVDFAISFSTVPLAELDTDVPIAVWTDATFPLLEQTYVEYARLSRRLKRAGMTFERAGLERAQLIFYASEWALASARDDFDVPPDRLGVLPFGANLTRPPDERAVAEATARRPGDPWRLIFIGADWERKRGDFAVAVARILNERGHRVELRMFGATPPHREKIPSYVRIEGFADKDSPQGMGQLQRALLESDLLLLPSRAECFGIAIGEANAAGVPCLASAVGGLVDAVSSGRNGELLEPTAGPDAYADAAIRLLTDPRAYRRLAANARAEFQVRLNWDTSVRRLLEKMSSIV
jgi:glycosyltransferase involved in cell wall biosynthesis